MEYSDGHDPAEPGEELTLDHQDLGPAQYDADHDGVADSVVIGQGNHTVLLTDTDGDGEIDHKSVVGADGTVQDPTSDDQGSPSTTDDSSTDGSSSGTSTDGTTTSTDGGSTGSEGSEQGAGGTISVLDAQGRSIEVGAPTVDMNGDGAPDTAVVRGEDGSTIGYTDRNGDGEADQITEIGTDRHVTISVREADGSWQVVQSGTLDGSGRFVPEGGEGSADGSADGTADAVPADTSGLTTDLGQSAALGLAATGGGDDGAATAEPAAADTSTGDDALTGAPGPIVYTDPEGNTYELGVPTEDFDGDGRPDTVVTTLDDGTVVGYSDVDGDGLTDQVTQINTDGTVTIGVPDGAGGWEQAATGTLGASGEFVPSA